MTLRAIPDVITEDQKTRDVLEAIKEVVEVLLGRRGTDTDLRLIKYGDVEISNAINAVGITAITVGAGADTIDMAALNTNLATLKTEVDAIVAVVNDIRTRLTP